MKLAAIEKLRSLFEKKAHGPKYELVADDTAMGMAGRQAVQVSRIRALRDIPEAGVSKGDLGGYIQSEWNLAHHGSAWVADKGKVYGRSLLCGTARVEDKAELKDTMMYDVTLAGDRGFIDGWGSIYGPLKVYAVKPERDQYGNQREVNLRLEADLISSQSGFVIREIK